MKFLYFGKDPVDVKVSRNGGIHTDTVTIYPTSGVMSTPDEELFEAMMTGPHKDLFQAVLAKVAKPPVAPAIPEAPPVSSKKAGKAELPAEGA